MQWPGSGEEVIQFAEGEREVGLEPGLALFQGAAAVFAHHPVTDSPLMRLGVHGRHIPVVDWMKMRATSTPPGLSLGR